jgi:hypothetical protein
MLNGASAVRREGVTVSGGADLNVMSHPSRWSLAFFISGVIEGGLNELGKDLYECIKEIALSGAKKGRLRQPKRKQAVEFVFESSCSRRGKEVRFHGYLCQPYSHPKTCQRTGVVDANDVAGMSEQLTFHPHRCHRTIRVRT